MTTPLRWQTPDSWADAALADPLALLDDHAHLEAKAASNALMLLSRWPGPNAPAGWVSRLSRIAREEAEHLRLVVNLLERRGGSYSKSHVNRYASDLRRLTRTGEGPKEHVDRLLLSALIEARSCERFEILSRRARDPHLARLYGALLASENQHYRAFLTLARRVFPRGVEDRWDELLAAEAEIIARQPPASRMF